MLNRIKAHFHVYSGHWELAFIILALVLGGVTTGYVLRGVQVGSTMNGMQAAHIQEVERIQAANRETLALLAGRLGQMAAQQDDVAQKVDRAAQTARSAAVAADGAAKNAARANIKVTEVPVTRHTRSQWVEP